MSQQINLFNPAFLKKEEPFTAVVMAQGLGLVLLGAVVMIVYTRIQLSRLSTEANTTAAQLALAKTQLQKFSSEYAPRQKSKSIEDEVRRMEIDVKSQQRAIDVMQEVDLGNTQGYSEYLRAFSRQIVNGVWLTGLSIQGAGGEIKLRGRALQSTLVPLYINRLRQEAIMKGKSFETLAMRVPGSAMESKGDKATVGTPSVADGEVEFVLQSAGAGNKVEAVGITDAFGE